MGKTRRGSAVVRLRSWISIRPSAFGLLEKVLAFLVGWAWYDTATAFYPAYSSSLLGYFVLAVSTSVLSLAIVVAGNQRWTTNSTDSKEEESRE